MRHLLDIEALTPDDIISLIDLADRMAEVLKRPIPTIPALRGKVVLSAFFEDSTRTRVSFETAVRRLSGEVMSFAAASSSVKKGESVRDTIQTLTAMGPDAIVVRHRSAGVPHQIAQWTDAAVINAGDGWHQHPTQGLLDVATARKAIGSLEGRRVVMVGDIVHSRVARSTTQAFLALGAEVRWVAPRTLLPPDTDWLGVTVHSALDPELADADICYVLRIQSERIGEALLPSVREYHDRYALTPERLDLLSPRALIMHPGPMIRGVEISAEAADDPRAIVLDQVAMGVAVRMAVLYQLLGVHPLDEPAHPAPKGPESS